MRQELRKSTIETLLHYRKKGCTKDSAATGSSPNCRNHTKCRNGHKVGSEGFANHESVQLHSWSTICPGGRTIYAKNEQHELDSSTGTILETTQSSLSSRPIIDVSYGSDPKAKLTVSTAPRLSCFGIRFLLLFVLLHQLLLGVPWYLDMLQVFH